MSDIRALLQDFEEGRYDGFWDGAHMSLLNEQEQQIVSRLIPARPEWLIDLGCGEGRLLPAYDASASQVVMVDYTMASLVRAEKKLSKRQDIHFIAADARHLPFRNSVFDAGVCVRMVNNYPSLGKTIQEMSRIFAPQAMVVVSYFNRKNLLRILKHGAGCFRKVHQFEFKGAFGLMCATHPDYFEEVVGRHGFHIKSNHGAGFSYQLSNSNPRIQALIANLAIAKALFHWAGRSSDLLLGRYRFALWQFAQLVKPQSLADGQKPTPTSLKDLLQCPHCRQGGIDLQDKAARCLICDARFQRNGKIIDFRLPG